MDIIVRGPSHKTCDHLMSSTLNQSSNQMKDLPDLVLKAAETTERTMNRSPTCPDVKCASGDCVKKQDTHT